MTQLVNAHETLATTAIIVIAACSVTAGARLATGHARDFAMLGIDIEEWPVGA